MTVPGLTVRPFPGCENDAGKVEADVVSNSRQKKFTKAGSERPYIQALYYAVVMGMPAMPQSRFFDCDTEWGNVGSGRIFSPWICKCWVIAYQQRRREDRSLAWVPLPVLFLRRCCLAGKMEQKKKLLMEPLNLQL